jgi:stringent starvation protein B
VDSKKPYLVKAIYDWCIDKNETPFVLVSPSLSSSIPSEIIDNGKVTFNISLNAVHNLIFEDSFIAFNARFGGKEESIVISYVDVEGIFSKESNDGMFFEIFRQQDLTDSENNSTNEDVVKTQTNNKTHLKLIK